MIEFNVNNYVWVKLTGVGIKELERQHRELREAFPGIGGNFEPPKSDDEGWSKWQMHDLMNRFGHMMSCGMQVPFETTIRIDV